MLSSNMLLLNRILLIDVTFSTPTPDDNILVTSGCTIAPAWGLKLDDPGLRSRAARVRFLLWGLQARGGH
jgi:hypothetical protein